MAKSGRARSLLRNVEGGLAVDLPADLEPLLFRSDEDEFWFEDIASSGRRLASTAAESDPASRLASRRIAVSRSRRCSIQS